MSLLDTFGEWLYANNSAEFKDYAETQHAVGERQQQIADGKFQSGKIDFIEYLNRTNLIADSEDATGQALDEQSSGWNFFKGTWLLWVALLVALFLWMGGLGWIRGVLAKKS